MVRKEVATSSQNDSKRSAKASVTCYFGNEGINNFVKNSEHLEQIGGTGSRVPGSRGGASAPPDPGDPADPVLILDTPTRQSEYANEFVKRILQAPGRRMYSRVHWGMMLPGRYSFLTLTNHQFKTDEQLEHQWRRFKWWIKRYRPGIAGCYCLTREGNGVIHMVLRLGMKMKKPDADEVREYWQSIGGGQQIKLAWVYERHKMNMAAYISDQRKKKGMAKEMSYQDMMNRWNRFGNWLPVGWSREFKRAWGRTMGMALAERLTLFKGWLLRYAEDPATWKPERPLTWDNEVGWVCLEQS